MTMERIDPELMKSNEELYVLWYLEELYIKGYIDLLEYESEAIVLGENDYAQRAEMKNSGMKVSDFKLVSERSYTFDFLVRWTDKARNVFFRNVHEFHSPDVYFISNLREDGREYSLIEIKGVYDQNNKTSEARVKIDWVWFQHKIYVQLVKPVPKVQMPRRKVSPQNALFFATFVPLRYFRTDGGGKNRKINFDTKTFDEYLEHLQTLDKKYI